MSYSKLYQALLQSKQVVSHEVHHYNPPTYLWLLQPPFFQPRFGQRYMCACSKLGSLSLHFVNIPLTSVQLSSITYLDICLSWFLPRSITTSLTTAHHDFISHIYQTYPAPY